MRQAIFGMGLCLVMGMLAACASDGSRAPVTQLGGEQVGSALVKFAIIGDYGQGPDKQGFDAERQVADMVAGWGVDFVVTVGDNNYGGYQHQPLGAASYNQFVCDYYGQWVPSSSGSSCTFNPAGLPASDPGTRFFPTPGNHDWSGKGTGTPPNCSLSGTQYSAYASFFPWAGKAGLNPQSASGTDLYYSFSYPWGSGEPLIQFYSFNANCDLTDSGSCASYGPSHGCSVNGDCAAQYQAQKAAIQATQRQSKANWSLVYLHQTPYSLGGDEACAEVANLNFQSALYDNANGQGLAAIVAGHSHNYQRIQLNSAPQVPFLVNGAGGTNLDSCDCSTATPAMGKAICTKKFGAIFGWASSTGLYLGFYRPKAGGGSVLVDDCLIIRDASGNPMANCSSHEKVTICRS